MLARSGREKEKTLATHQHNQWRNGFIWRNAPALVLLLLFIYFMVVIALS
jgi:hypothetical protein